jgi:hypothetical protein
MEKEKEKEKEETLNGRLFIIAHLLPQLPSLSHYNHHLLW